MRRHPVILVLCGLLVAGAPAAVAATITVTTTSDSVSQDGACSLREAIEAANTNLLVNECAAGDPGLDSIGFAIPGDGVMTLSPQSELPAFTEPVTLDGLTQPGAMANSDEMGTNAVLRIELDGSGAGQVFGLTFQAGASGSLVRGLVINRFRSGGAEHGGIFLDGASDVAIQGNFIGTDPTGMISRPNWWGINLFLSDGNLIGGSAPGDRNLVSGNFNTGIRLHRSDDNVVIGNYIGLDATGAGPLGNGNQGLRTDSCEGTVIGGLDSGEANVLSDNGDAGIRLASSTALVEGNYIGTDASGSVALGNGSAGVGVFGAGGSAITRNTIFGNGGLGIDLDVDGSAPIDGVTPNDPGDGDSGANDLQNFPLLSSAVVSDGVTSVEGTLNSLPDRAYTVELFTNPVCDDSDHGEGQVFLDTVEVVTDSSGNADFSVDLFSVTLESAVTATATNDSGKTSEFSPCAIVTPEPSLLLLEGLACAGLAILTRRRRMKMLLASSSARI